MPPTSAPALDRPVDLPHPPPPDAVATERVNRLTSIPFWLLHLLPLLAVFTGVSVRAVVLCVVLYYGRMFFITAGYHRYFSHRSYRLNRFWQFVMAFGGTTAAQKGPLWWAAHHRDHHRFSDSERDVHSPTQKGFFWSHVGWILCDKYAATEFDRIRDFSKYPELVFLNKKDWIGPWALAIASYLIAGWSGLLIGFFLSTVLLWHATFTVNSLAHVMGRRRYATDDTSRNSVLIALLTMGEGWHNNHHYYQASARQGFFWWEVDASYYLLKLGSWLGIVKNLRTPPARVLQANRVEQGAFDVGMFKAYWGKANKAVLRSHVGQIVHEGRVSASDALSSASDVLSSASDALSERKEALEEFVLSSLESAEELARATRVGQRDLATDR
jgi:stearoyl-CoA desaturase (delta-9 desaturase)